jgi:hypothetical protein
MAEAIDELRKEVKAWYREEAARLAEAFEDDPDIEKLSFDELVRRSQILFACEMFELAKDEEKVRFDPGSPDYIQLQRVAHAMRDRGVEVPESIRDALGEE